MQEHFAARSGYRSAGISFRLEQHLLSHDQTDYAKFENESRDGDASPPISPE